MDSDYKRCIDGVPIQEIPEGVAGEGAKRCIECGDWFPPNAFIEASTPHGYESGWCVFCGRKRSNEYHEFLNEQQFGASTGPLLTMVLSAKQRAKERGLAFNISVEDLHIPEFCPILGIPLFSGVRHQTDNSPSLDRIVPEMGYVRGNVKVISSRANRLKSNATLAEILAIAKYIVEYGPSMA